MFADEESPFYCSFTGTIVEDQFLLAIVHDTNADNGRTQTFATVYKHLSTVIVSLDDIVTAGQQIGVVSEASGCSTEPNLQFSVRPALADDESMDFIDRFRTRVDPYGWFPEDDPLRRDPSLDVVFHRALNQLFWLPGQAPDVN